MMKDTGLNQIQHLRLRFINEQANKMLGVERHCIS
jgi:hypothetical protein